MSDNNIVRCHFHPKRIALSVCERCQRPICLEDKRTLDGITITNSDFHYSVKNTHNYCLICYGTELENQTRTIEYFVVEFIFFILSLIFVSLIKEFAALWLSIIVVFIPIFIFTIIFVNKTTIQQNIADDDILILKQSASEKNDYCQPGYDFDKSTNFEYLTTLNKNNDITKIDLYSIVCFECGRPIKKHEKYCPDCGVRTKDELLKRHKIYEIN